MLLVMYGVDIRCFMVIILFILWDGMLLVFRQKTMLLRWRHIQLFQQQLILQTLRDRLMKLLLFMTGIWKLTQQILSSINGLSGFLFRCLRKDLLTRKKCQLTGVHHVRQVLLTKKLLTDVVKDVEQKLQRRTLSSGC